MAHLTPTECEMSSTRQLHDKLHMYGRNNNTDSPDEWEWFGDRDNRLLKFSNI